MAKGLIARDTLDRTLLNRQSLTDEFLGIAYTIEQSMLTAGAVPGEDYTLLDLYKLAQPFALESYRDDSRAMEIDYPAQ